VDCNFDFLFLTFDFPLWLGINCAFMV